MNELKDVLTIGRYLKNKFGEKNLQGSNFNIRIYMSKY